MAWIEKGSSENIYDYIRRKEKQEDWDSCEGKVNIHKPRNEQFFMEKN